MFPRLSLPDCTNSLPAMDRFTATGLWWLPEAPDDKLTGTLSFDSEDGGDLSLIGAWNAPEASGALSTSETREAIRAVHGATTTGAKYTLLQCRFRGSSMGTGAWTTRYQTPIILKGGHTPTLAALRVSRLQVRVANLEAWYGFTAISRSSIPGDETGQADHRIRIEASLVPHDPSPTVVETSFGRVRLHTTVALSYGMAFDVSLRQRARLVVEYDSPVPFERAIHRDAYHLQNLLTLAIGDAVPLTDVEIVLDTGVPEPYAVRTASDGDGGRTALPLLNAFLQLSRAGRASGEAVMPYRMCFQFREVELAWGQIVRALFESADNLASVYALYFSIEFGAVAYLESRFLNYAQAAEVLERKLGLRGGRVGADVFSRVLAAWRIALDSSSLGLTDEQKGILWQGMEYRNEPSLRQRLRALLALEPAELARDLSVYVGGSTHFVNRVVALRNELTHHGPGRDRSSREVEKLLRTTHQLETLLKVRLMQALGIPLPLLERVVTRAQADARGLRLLWADET